MSEAYLRVKDWRAKQVAKYQAENPGKFAALPGETFVDLPGLEGEYQVSNMGRIKSLKTKRGLILKPKRNWAGYEVICLCKDNVKKNYSVHSLVLIAFVSNRPQGYIANHKDGNKANNHLSNLEWITQAENVSHSHVVLGNPYGSPPVRCGEKHHCAKLTKEKVVKIRELYATGEYPSRRLGAMFGVSKVNIMNIVNNKVWRDI